MPYKIVLLIITLWLLISFNGGCGPSPVTNNDYAIPWCQVQNSVWYIEGNRNNLCEFILYKDSVIIYEYIYSPVDQSGQGYTYPQYTVMTIERRKLELLRKDISYLDGDGEWMLMQEYRGYQTTLSGVKIFDYSSYNSLFIIKVTPTEMHMGMYDEFNDIQEAWILYHDPVIDLNFMNYEGWELYR